MGRVWNGMIEKNICQSPKSMTVKD